MKTLGQPSTLREKIIVPVLLVALAVLGERWLTELGENTKLKSQLERAEERVGNQSKELANLRTKNEELERLHPILQFYGTRAKLVASFDIKKEVGSTLTIGNCPRAPCFVFTWRGMIDEHATLGLKGVWDEMEAKGDNAIAFGLPLKKGCRKEFRMSQYHVDFVIEDDRYLYLKAGIGISVISPPVKGLAVHEIPCP